MSMTNYLEEALLNAALRGVSYSSPSGVYLALSSGVVDESQVGLGEVTNTGYVRQSVSFFAPTQVNGSGLLYNSNTVEYPEAVDSWGTITHAIIFDNASSGNAMFVSNFENQRTVTSGTALRIPVSGLSVYLN